jgi:hypothetical protein
MIFVFVLFNRFDSSLMTDDDDDICPVFLDLVLLSFDINSPFILV